MKSRLIPVILFLFACFTVNAQADFSGTWNGTLNVAGELHLVLHVTQLPDGSYSGTLDSPDQNVSGIKCDKVEAITDASGNKLTFAINNIKVSYTGTLLNDSTLSGTFTQGAKLPLDLHRSDIPYVAKVKNRPQTPKPPFPYKSEEVVYSANGLQYGGTITIPQGSGSFPAVLLITGSGAQDRDETIFSHKPFAVLADALTRDGFIVLRVDDRGIGNSTGNFSASTTADFVNDVNASLNYLKSRHEVNNKKIGLLGHSEGAMIAPVVASQRKDINFTVLLAAPGVKIADLMAEQNAAVMRSMGIDSLLAENYKPVYKQLVNTIVSAPDTATAIHNALQVINNSQSKMDSATLSKLGIYDREFYLKQMVTLCSTPWFKYFIQFDPKPYLTKLKKVKVLALNGSRDIQVVSRQNLPAVRSALVAGSTRTFEVKELPGLNHLFQTCTKCTVAEYGQLEETISPVALQTITNWLNANVK
ncbi:MAG TPA: alpha/beta fold hydrolase [Parafilimonas sp.]|nr:alpha/beta fold hydrolase [Parafilimonas sp.]